MERAISISGRRIGPSEPVCAVAEMLVGHDQDFDRVVEIVRAASGTAAGLPEPVDPPDGISGGARVEHDNGMSLVQECQSELIRHQYFLWAQGSILDMYGLRPGVSEPDAR